MPTRTNEYRWEFRLVLRLIGWVPFPFPIPEITGDGSTPTLVTVYEIM